MKKLYSLIRACMTSDMNIFKIKTKNNSKKSKIMLPIFISLCFMFAIWTYANMLFEELSPLHLQFVVLSLFVFVTSIITLIEGIYKTSSLIFNSKDDDLLLSLPIPKRTVVFIRIFKFYVFELLFNSLFIIPLVIAYIRWADTLNISFFITSLVMIFMLPIIPIVLSCIIGAITSSLSSRFKHKKAIETVISMLFLLIIFIGSYNLESFFEYLARNATSVNDMITKIYYPAGLYANLSVNFNILELLKFILINIIIFILLIVILSKNYFKINSRLKNVTTVKKVRISKLTIKSESKTKSLIKKEINTFFSIPVFIINAGFGLLLFIVAVVMILLKYDSFISLLTDPTIGMSLDLIKSNTSIIVFILILVTSFMTSITNSVISLEGKNINILKSLPLDTKDILMSKIYACMCITTPILFIGSIILFIKLKISIIECLLLLILLIIVPLVSHFIGIIINLKFPKLDYENASEVVKQSISSFISVMIGMVLVVISYFVIMKVFGVVSSTIILLVSILIFIIIDIVLYWYLTNISVKDFNNLSI